MPSAKFAPPSAKWMNFVTLPWQWWFKPTFSGWENIPDHSRLLFVGNHTIFGFLDIPAMTNGLYQEKGLYLRGLGDRVHFKVPGWSQLLKGYGAVEGTPQQCARLMQANEPVLVFPGGGREVCKRKGESYQLIWKARSGFAQLAAEHQYTIIPFAAVGAEECYDILWDANDWSRLLPAYIKRTTFYKNTLRNGELIFPLSAGLKGSPLPKRVRLDFAFGSPVETTNVDSADKRQIWALREQVRFSIATQLAELNKSRQQP